MLWAGVALAVLGALLGAAPERAVADEETDGYFSDDDGSVHEPALEALASRGVLAGIECGEGLICPSEPLKRWEMAVWLARVLDGAHPGSVDTERFSDVDYDMWWAPSVEQLFDSGITVGCRRDPLQYCPHNPVTRAQMATFLKRAFDLEPAPSAGFTDVSGDSHGANIDALAAAGITVGCSRDPLRYCPTRSVTRGQMASFLARALGLIELPGAMRFTAVDAGWWHSCGLRASGGIDCWGSNPFGQADAPEESFTAVAAGAHHSCGLRSDGSVDCWGRNDLGQASPPTGRFTALSAGWWHSCGLRTDGSIDCWGVNWNGRADPPGGQFSEVAVGDEFSCGLRGDGSIACWGRPHEGQVPAGRFSTIAVGQRHSCGVRVDGTIACWGANWAGQTDPPEGRFSAAAVGLGHSCGVRVDGTIACWGSNGLGKAEAPPGQYVAVAAGERHSCGLASEGAVVCWGGDSIAQTGAPSGQFTNIDAGRLHLCGVSVDGSLSCWGDNFYGQSGAPEGQFRAVTADWDYSCGLRTDGTVACWGLARVVPPPSDVVTGTESTLVDRDECRQRGTRGSTTAGFPLPLSALPSTGTLRVAVLFVDFPDAVAPHSTLHEAELGLPFMDRFLEASSYGQLRVEAVPHHGWLRAEHGYGHYLHGSSVGSESVALGIAEEAIGLADAAFDFNGIDALMIVHPSSHFGGGSTAQERVDTQEGTVRTLLVNTFRVDGPEVGREWGAIAAHELLHNLGLVDLYAYDASRHEAPADTGHEAWFLTQFGPMRLSAYSPADPGGYRRAIEMLAWSRWQLGWLADPHVQCVVSFPATVALSPVAGPGDGIAMAGVPLSDTEVIVIESRHSTGYDSGSALLAEGVLVYTVDAGVSSGLLPIKLAGDPGNAHLDDYPLLAVGESVTVRGYTITVVADDGDTYTVTIAKSGDG